jgi:hypothetical protein
VRKHDGGKIHWNTCISLTWEMTRNYIEVACAETKKSPHKRGFSGVIVRQRL